MSNLIARLLLAMLLFPLALLVALGAGGVLSSTVGPSRSNEWFIFIGSGLVTWVFIGCYWWALWRKSVQWTRERVQKTLAGVPLVLIIAGTAGAVIGNCVAPEAGMMFFMAAAALLWLVWTIIAWRETPRERLERLRAGDASAVVCPVCGYNLTGQKQLRCPECGAEFSLEQLLASQPARAQAELGPT